MVTFDSFEDSTAVLTGFTITNGYAQGDYPDNAGGGICCFNSSPSLVNVEITENSATSDYGVGGGIKCYDSDPSLSNVTISNNSSYFHGGGIHCSNNSSPSLVNCILWNDTPQEVYFNSYQDPNSITISYSDIEGGEAGIITNNNGIVYWEEGNIDSNPLFFDPNAGDYHLTHNSPCVDTGTPDTTGLNLPLWDLDGNIRIWDGNDDGTAIIDMGPYEYDAPVYAIDDEPQDIAKQNFINYPNPITAKSNDINIRFSLKKSSKVNIKLYNIKGQLVTEILNDNKPSGSHTITSNINNLATGIYFIKMDVDGRTRAVKKMVKIE